MLAWKADAKWWWSGNRSSHFTFTILLWWNLKQFYVLTVNCPCFVDILECCQYESLVNTIFFFCNLLYLCLAITSSQDWHMVCFLILVLNIMYVGVYNDSLVFKSGEGTFFSVVTPHLYEKRFVCGLQVLTLKSV